MDANTGSTRSPHKPLVRANPMQSLDASRIPEACAMMCRTLGDDPLHAFIFPDAASRPQRLQHLYRFKLRTQLAHCYITSDRVEGLAIWERPGQHLDEITLHDVRHAMLFPFRMGLRSLARMIAFQNFCTRVRKSLVRDPYWYLDVVTVDPAFQGKGLGRQLMRPFLEEAETAQQPVYLETQDPANVRMYLGYGFRVAHQERIAGSDLVQHCMIRD